MLVTGGSREEAQTSNKDTLMSQYWYNFQNFQENDQSSPLLIHVSHISHVPLAAGQCESQGATKMHQEDGLKLGAWLKEKNLNITYMNSALK